LKDTLHKVLNVDSAPQLPQRRQKQIDILNAVSAAEDLLYGPRIDDLCKLKNNNFYLCENFA